MTRQAEILRWLVSSPLAIPLWHGRGFFVLRGLTGTAWPMGRCAGRAGLVATPPGGEYAEKLTFFNLANSDPHIAKRSS